MERLKANKAREPEKRVKVRARFYTELVPSRDNGEDVMPKGRRYSASRSRRGVGDNGVA